jgi:small subunit ribosomal protein S6
MAVESKLYEAMFLVDAAEADADWEGVESNVRNIIERVGAEIISLRKWDTRRLAYDVDRKSRGTYILCYFRADGERIAEIERTVQLSERIMRVLILSAAHVGQEDIEKGTPAMPAERQEEGTDVEAAGAAAEETVAEPAGADKGSEPAKVSAKDGFETEAVGVSGEAGASGPEQSGEDETKDGSASADEPGAEKTEETEK